MCYKVQDHIKYKVMDRVMLSLRLHSLEIFLNKIENSKTEKERMTLALEASQFSDKIMKLTPEDQIIHSNLDFFSLAVFADNITWARECLNSIKNSSVNYF